MWRFQASEQDKTGQHVAFYGFGTLLVGLKLMIRMQRAELRSERKNSPPRHEGHQGVSGWRNVIEHAEESSPVTASSAWGCVRLESW